jgi:ABC-2 type transport system ATP-binding protein
MQAISINNLGKTFGKTAALKSLDLEIKQGEIFGLVGPDGAGKTTLIRILCGIMRPTEGTASVFGDDVVKHPEKAKQHLGYMSQRFSLYQDLSVQENIRFFQDLYKVPRDQRRERMDRLLEFSRLGPFRDRPAGKLSGGMKQKLGLCCALIHTPRILFLDEPTTGVDPISRRELWSLLYDLWNDGLTILVSTPYMDEAERCSRTGFLQRGEMIATGTPQEVTDSYPHEMVELTSEGALGLSESLSAIEGILDIHHYGDRLHIAVENPDRILPLIREKVGSDTQALQSLRRVKPSLEDVFLQYEEAQQ